MNRSALLLFCYFLSSCVGSSLRTHNDFAEIATVSLGQIERNRTAKAILVVPAGIDPRARSALASLRKVIAPDTLPQSDEFELPEGYFLLRVFKVSEDSALFKGTWGPLYRPKPETLTAGCGDNLDVSLYREGHIWVVRRFSETAC